MMGLFSECSLVAKVYFVNLYFYGSLSRGSDCGSSQCWVSNWSISISVSSVCGGSNVSSITNWGSGISSRVSSISNWGSRSISSMSISSWGIGSGSISNWGVSNDWGSNWLKVEVRLSINLGINIWLSGDLLMDISFSINLGINISLSSDLSMDIRLSFNLDINIWLSKRVQVSVCYGRIIMSSIYSSNWRVSISSDRLSSITISIWTSSVSSMSYGGSSGVSIGSGVGVTISGCWDNSSTSRGHTGKDCNKGIHSKLRDASTV